jgi:hypothetical protein
MADERDAAWCAQHAVTAETAEWQRQVLRDAAMMIRTGDWGGKREVSGGADSVTIVMSRPEPLMENPEPALKRKPGRPRKGA